MTLDHEIGVQIPMPQQINVRVSELVQVAGRNPVYAGSSPVSDS